MDSQTHCWFCEGKTVGDEEHGDDGYSTMMNNINRLFGRDSIREYQDGIWLTDDNKLAHDNSSGEYASGRIKISFCPFCGRGLK